MIMIMMHERWIGRKLVYETISLIVMLNVINCRLRLHEAVVRHHVATVHDHKQFITSGTLHISRLCIKPGLPSPVYHPLGIR